MSTKNFIHETIRCSRCGIASKMEIELFFGYGDLIEYHLGDLIQWARRNAVNEGGRPPDGNLDGEGYAECPRCNKDFFVTATVRNDRLTAVEPNPSKTPYVP